MCIRDRHDIDIKSILLSFPAWVVYVFVCLTIMFAMLRERYKSMSQRVEVLNVKLNDQDSMIRSLQEMMKIVPFKGRFFLTTEYLYNELGEYIPVSYTHLDILIFLRIR